MNAPFNVFADLPVSPDEVFEDLAHGAHVRIQRIVSRGQASPPGFWYDQDEDEWVLVLHGAARLRLRDPDEVLALNVGDALLIAAHRKHRVEWTTPDEPTVWLAVFSGFDRNLAQEP